MCLLLNVFLHPWVLQVDRSPTLALLSMRPTYKMLKIGIRAQIGNINLTGDPFNLNASRAYHCLRTMNILCKLEL